MPEVITTFGMAAVLFLGPRIGRVLAGVGSSLEFLGERFRAHSTIVASMQCLLLFRRRSGVVR